MSAPRGFTLVETIITVGISTALIAALATVFLVFQNLYRYQGIYRSASDTVGRVMRSAEDATLPAYRIIANHTFSNGSQSSSANALVLQLPSVTAGGVVVANAYDYTAFYLASSTAYEVVEAAPGSARRVGIFTLGGGVTGFSFAYDNADPTIATKVTIDVTASSTAKGQAAWARAKETLRLRNF